MAKTPYLPENEYANTYYDAQKQARLFFLPFNEYERLAANKLRDDLPPNIPRVNDGSLAALISETPMRILAQAFTGDVKVTESIDPKTGASVSPQPWLSELANVVWNKEIVPNANTQAPFLQKMQLAMYRALVYGSCPIYTFFTKRGNYTGPDFTIPYIRDVYLEVGKHSDADSDYIFMDTYYTRLQIDRIIASANKIEENGVKSPWDIPTLIKIRDSHVESQKDYLSKNPAERNRPVRSTQIKLTTVFQRGVGAPFNTFYAEGNRDDLMIVRRKVNEDPTGDLPIHFLYAYEDLFNPYGKGQIELAGGTQNVLDYMVQLHVLANQIGLQPPILVEGDRSLTDLDSMIYSPSQFWFTGAAKVDVMETSSSMVKEFPQAYSLYKSNLVNMQGTSTVDVSSESGDPSNGKTPAAISQNNARENSHDNYLRSQAVQTFGKVFKSMLNIKFANMQGSDILKLEQTDAVKLSRAGLIPTDENGNPQTNEIELEWDNLRGHFDFKVDPDSSIVKDNADQVAKLTDILQFLQENPYMLQYIHSTGFDLNIGEIYAQIFTKLGLQDTEKILTPLSSEDKAQAQAIPPMVFDKPAIQLHYTDMPANAQLQLLNRLGLQVSLMDVLAGPVLDPNIRGVFSPEPEPGQVLNPIGGQGMQQQPNQPPVPQSAQTQIVLPSGSSVEPREAMQAQPNAPMNPTPSGLQPTTSALLQQVMNEKGVSKQVAQGIIHARALGLPENEIEIWLKNNQGQ